MVNQHFFQPLLPGFRSHLKIPVAFFLKNIEGRTEKKTATLRSEASKISWEVKLDGQKLSDGWEEFALAHDLRIGDIVIFRQEKDITFHVTILGPSCCEIQYESCLNDQNKPETIERKKKVKQNPKRETKSSSPDSSCFMAKATRLSFKEDRLFLPMNFVRENGLDTRCGEIVLMDEKGGTWTLALKRRKTCGMVYFHRGWRSFCVANGLKAGDFFTFKLSRKGGTVVLRLSYTDSEEEECSKGDEIVSLSTESDIVKESRSTWKASSSASQNLEKVQRNKKVKKNPKRETSSLDPSCFVVYVAPYTLRYDELHLPVSFVREHGLDKRCGDTVLIHEKGRSWTFVLKQKKSRRTVYINRGWRSFCRANGLKAGDSFTFKLIQRGRTLVLRMSPRESEEEEYSEGDEVDSLSSDSDSDEEKNQEQEEKSYKKIRSRWNPLSLPSQNRFVTLTLTPYNVKKGVLFLPSPFTRINGINEETKMSLLDNNGVKWSTKLRSENRRLKMVGGWRDCFRASNVETGESVVLKLIWEEDTSCVLMFCSKVKPESK